MAPLHSASVALLTLLASACASRDVTPAYPEGSAASPRAPQARQAVVTRALESEPPMPGTSAEGWAGLAPASTEPQPKKHGAGHVH